jgi:hypothetical protein
MFESISTRIKRRLPPSRLFNCQTAWPVGPVPAKESRMTELASVTCSISCSISSTGFGKANTFGPRISESAFVAETLPGASRIVQNRDCQVFS